MTTIRPAREQDIAATHAIYAHHVAHGFGSFEEAAPDLADMTERWRSVVAKGLPYLVAEVDGVVAGFAYAGPYRPRSAYRYAVEDSVYVAPGRMGQGVGRALLEAVIAACEDLGLRRMLAFIGDSANAGSIGVHRACGFRDAGKLSAVGFKAGQWLDVVVMERDLGGDGLHLPAAKGLDPG